MACPDVLGQSLFEAEQSLSLAGYEYVVIKTVATRRPKTEQSSEFIEYVVRQRELCDHKIEIIVVQKAVREEVYQDGIENQ